MQLNNGFTLFGQQILGKKNDEKEIELNKKLLSFIRN